MLTSYLVIVLLAIILFFIIGWFTGNDEYGAGSKDDERSQFIKRKAIVSSWILLSGFLFVNFVFDYFNLHRVETKQDYPELFYLVLLVVSYFVYYWIYNRRFSTNEK